MAKPLLPNDLWAISEPLLPSEPPEPPEPKGGRPRVSDRACLTGILFVLRSGIPLVARITGANRHESAGFEDPIVAVPPIKRPSGHRRQRPGKLHADKAYDVPRRRRALTRRHIKVRIARKGKDSSARLGRHR
ncbi:MAG: hypothetical protein QOJ59_5309 [Thermomicrobiales bacterium]|jgi:hypothetical protein|nr:hypothetical protein [Thermomicrobiales bacterium]